MPTKAGILLYRWKPTSSTLQIPGKPAMSFCQDYLEKTEPDSSIFYSFLHEIGNVTQW